MTLLNTIGNYLERYVRFFIIFITNFLPVKVIRDDAGRPFLYRYHLFSFTNDGPGVCIHHFIKSDPDRGYHDHPWKSALSFILCGEYDERILNNDDMKTYTTYTRKRWTFNALNGENSYHRVMIKKGGDAWTIFAFAKRSKTWGMVSLNGEYKAMSTTVKDGDGGWWNIVGKGFGLHSHVKHSGTVTAMVDIAVFADKKILLIKRSKDPYKDMWAFPGDRIEQKDDSILAAAKRELFEETNIRNSDLSFIKTIGNPHRDPRGFCITNVFACYLMDEIPNVKAGSDAIDYQWFDIDNLPPMAFDHADILKQLI